MVIVSSTFGGQILVGEGDEDDGDDESDDDREVSI